MWNETEFVEYVEGWALSGRHSTNKWNVEYSWNAS